MWLVSNWIKIESWYYSVKYWQKWFLGTKEDNGPVFLKCNVKNFVVSAYGRVISPLICKAVWFPCQSGRVFNVLLAHVKIKCLDKYKDVPILSVSVFV